VRIFTEELPNLSMYFQPTPIVYVAALKGPEKVDPAANTAWNVYQWEFR